MTLPRLAGASLALGLFVSFAVDRSASGAEPAGIYRIAVSGAS